MSDKPKSEDKSKGFTNRPSLGLKIWGPLVPAADNRKGLWTLWTIQTGVGIYALYRFRKLHLKPMTTTSMATGTMVNGNYLPPSLNRFAKQSTPLHHKTAKWRKYVSLVVGMGLLSQSCLEYCRLKLLPFDPWYDEARVMRDKKFFNDIIKFYYKDDHSLDNIKIVRLSDPSDTVTPDKDDNTVDSHTPHQHQSKNLSSMEWRQSIAIIKAQREQINPVIKWLGPFDYKPMTFGQYLDALEYYLSMKEIWQANDVVLIRPGLKESYDTLCDKNQEWRRQIINGSSLLPTLNSNESAMSKETGTLNSRIENRTITIDPVMQSKDSIDLNEIWTLHDPWMNLALDTSLSIKFIPTSTNAEKKE